MESNSNQIADAIIALLESERFYGEIICGMRRKISKAVPTAGVCIKDVVELHINPDFFCNLKLDEQVAVLKHECEHILRDHIARFKELAPEVYAKPDENADVVDKITDNIINNKKHQVFNIAADCAINYSLPNLPEGGMYPKLFDLKDGETMERYAEQLKNNKKLKEMQKPGKGQKGEGEPNGHGHELWGESDDNKETLKEKVRQAVNNAAKRTRAAGHMTAEHELLVSKLNSSQTINWREQLKRFAARSLETKIESSKKKRNRRYGISIPGEVKFEDLNIGVAIDTSGSVSDEALNQFLAELDKMSRYAKIWVVEADSEIKNSYEFNPKKTYSFKGRGGTAYQPAFDFYNKQKPQIDALIYFGDMDAFDKPNKPRYPVLWATVGTQKPPAEFGSQIFVKVDHE
jgi:predicted metal-dependent peptidase